MSVEEKITIDTIRGNFETTGKLWEDPEFPAAESSVFHSKTLQSTLVWKRPFEIAEHPKMSTGGQSRFDIVQGMTRSETLLAPLAGLAQVPELLKQVVPEGQVLEGPGYCGAVQFRFWQFGEWIDIIVDDRLLTAHNRLVFAHSSQADEFWGALLEKAYAKLLRSYEDIGMIDTSEAMVDLSGGITSRKQLTSTNYVPLANLKNAFAKQCLMCATIVNKSGDQSKTTEGLITNLPYSITGFASPVLQGTSVDLIRLLSTQGNGAEWTGMWSDSSSVWQALPELEKERVGLTVAEDGEFWMSLADFKARFTYLEICAPGPGDPMLNAEEPDWARRVFHNSWTPGINAGGCRNYPDTFWTNPQYWLRLTGDTKQDVAICLSQRNRSQQHLEYLAIGFLLYRIESDVEAYKIVSAQGKTVLNRQYFIDHNSYARGGAFAAKRDNSARFKLPPGDYVLVPSTFNANDEAEFTLQIHTAHSNVITEESLPEETVPEETSSSSSPEPEVDPALLKLFNNFAGSDGYVDVHELLKLIPLLLRRPEDSLSLAAGRAVVACVDSDRSGMLNVREFEAVLPKLLSWGREFTQHDKDGTQRLSPGELCQALAALGFTLSPENLAQVLEQYGIEAPASFEFCDYLQIVATLENARTQ